MSQTSSSVQIDIQALLDIIKEAGSHVLEIYNADNENWEVSAKDDNSPLTKADRAANDFICQKLKDQYPDIPIISEENKEVDYEERKQYELFWLIDPLDGTKEFIKRNGEFTINLALVQGDKPVAGIVYAPALGRLYYGAKEQGAYLWNEHNEIHQLEANTFSMTDEGLHLVASRSHTNEETEGFINQFKAPELVSMGSSLKFMLVAEGKADIYPRIAPTMEWDTGASQIIVEEAGAKVLNYEDQQPLTYNKEDLHNPWFVVYGNVKA